MSQLFKIILLALNVVKWIGVVAQQIHSDIALALTQNHTKLHKTGLSGWGIIGIVLSQNHSSTPNGAESGDDGRIPADTAGPSHRHAAVDTDFGVKTYTGARHRSSAPVQIQRHSY